MIWTFLPAIFVAIWSTGYTVAGYVMPHADPLTFLTARYLIAFALLAPVSLAIGARWPSAPSWWAHALLSGALLHGSYQGAIWWAIQHGLPAGIAALIAAMQPIFTALAAGPLVGERLGLRRWLGVALGFAGVATVVAPKLEGAGVALLGWPVIFAVIGTVAVTAATLHQKRALAGTDIRALAPVQFVGAVAVTAPFALALEAHRFEATPGVLFAMGWAVLVLSIAAVVIMMAMVAHGEVSRVAALVYLVPPLTALQAYLLLGETLSAIQLCGMGLAALGVLLANRAEPSRPAASAPR